MPTHTIGRQPEAFAGAEVYLLRDKAAGSSARLVPGQGFNLLSFQVRLGGHDIETILPPPPGPLPVAFRFGNAVLFPFPNRIREGRFEWRGQTFQLDRNWHGHHIHGLVADAPWSVVEAFADDACARLTAELRSEDHPDITRQYPFPFTLTATYTLHGNTLAMETRVRNTGTSEMPMGFGIHPYFRIPLLPGGSRGECEVSIPSARHWELDDDLIATGRVLDLPPELDFRAYRPLDQTFLDHVLTDLQFDGATTAGRVYDPHADVELSVKFGREFRELVVYAPLVRDAICFEPYTCPTNAINLEAQGVSTGIIVLAPGDTWRGEVWFHAREGRSPSDG